MRSSPAKAIPLHTERLFLDPLTSADFDDIFRIAQEKRSIEDFQYVASKPEDVRAWLEPGLENPLNLIWVVREQERAVGLFDLFFEAEYSNTEKDVCRVGYFLDHEVQGQGYASEALTAIANWVFAEAGATRIEAGVTLHNTASWRTLEKAGFVREKIVPRNWTWRGEVYDSAYYYLTDALFRRML